MNASNTELDQAFWNSILWLWKKARLAVVFVVGMTVLLIGIGMIVLPGPALVFIPLGLAILATEFVWARRWLDHIDHHVKRFRGKKKTPGEGESASKP